MRIDKLTDQAVLAKIVVEDKDSEIRVAAIEKLTDQAVLAKIAVEDKSFVRGYAIKKLTDQGLLEKFAVDLDESPVYRSAAVRNLTNQALLAKIAMEDKIDIVREAAVEKLTDQAILERIAIWDTSCGVKLAAIATLTDPLVLWKIGGLGGGERLWRRESCFTAAARIRLALLDPIIADRIPNAALITHYLQVNGPLYEKYRVDPHGITPMGRVEGPQGEYVRFVIFSGARQIAEFSSQSSLPTIPRGVVGVNGRPIVSVEPTAAEPAVVDLEKLMTELFVLGKFTQEDLRGLTQSRIPEVAPAAQAKLKQPRATEQPV